MNKKIVLKGVGIGVIILVITEIIFRGYVFFLMKLFPSNACSTSTIAFAIPKLLHLVGWMCRPGSKILLLFGESWMQKIFAYPMHSVIFLHLIDLIFWSGVSIYILGKKQKS